MDIRSKVIEIIADQAIMGIDSLGLVESIFAIEEAFDIQVPFNANQPNESSFDLSSVATIVQGIEKLIQEQS